VSNWKKESDNKGPTVAAATTVTPEERAVRQAADYRRVRRAEVFKSEGGRCQVCRGRAKRFDAYDLGRLVQLPDGVVDLWVTLCDDCRSRIGILTYKSPLAWFLADLEAALGVSFSKHLAATSSRVVVDEPREVVEERVPVHRADRRVVDQNEPEGAVPVDGDGQDFTAFDREVRPPGVPGVLVAEIHLHLVDGVRLEVERVSERVALSGDDEAESHQPTVEAQPGSGTSEVPAPTGPESVDLDSIVSQIGRLTRAGEMGTSSLTRVDYDPARHNSVAQAELANLVQECREFLTLVRPLSLVPVDESPEAQSPS